MCDYRELLSLLHTTSFLLFQLGLVDVLSGINFLLPEGDNLVDDVQHLHMHVLRSPASCQGFHRYLALVLVLGNFANEA